MKKFDILNNAGRTFHKVGFKLKKHSPEILITAGVIGTVASGVMACRATTKLSGILESAKNDIDVIHHSVEHADELPEEYTVEDSKKDLTIVYVQTGVKILKLYLPSIALGALSLTAIVTSNNILRKRNMALAAAYATVDKSFKDYRKRVVERFGEELDRELKYNIKAKEIEETVVDEKGKEKTVKKTVEVVDPNEYSEFARFFDDGCLGWTKNPETNLFYVKCQQNYANEKLKSQGYLFLNDVYDMFGIPRTKAGQIVGWIYDKNNVDGDNDNFVDFGIFNPKNGKARDFVNGHERVILMDFNVDGNIWDLM